MNEGEQLFAAVLAEPDDDTARLVYADWLQENGDGERAEFVRAQVRYAALPQDDPGRPALFGEIQRRWQTHMARWRRELPQLPGVTWGEFRRGFVDTAGTVGPATFVKYGARIVAAAPVTEVSFQDPADLGRLARSPAFSRVRALRLGHGRKLTDADVCPILGSPHCPKLRELHVGFEKLGTRFAVALAACPQMAELHELVVCGNTIGDAGLAALAASPHLTRLRVINAHSTGVTDAGVEALAASAALSGLTDLHLGDEFGPPAARALAASTRLTNLTQLTLSHHGIGTAGTRALAESRNAARLESLTLQGWATGVGRIGPGGAVALAESPHLRRLTALLLLSAAIGDAGAVALANSPNVANLVTLNLTTNGLSDVAVDALVRSPYLTRLAPHGPCLYDNPGITPAGMAAVSARFHHPAAPRTAAGDDVPF